METALALPLMECVQGSQPSQASLVSKTIGKVSLLIYYVSRDMAIPYSPNFIVWMERFRKEAALILVVSFNIFKKGMKMLMDLLYLSMIFRLQGSMFKCHTIEKYRTSL